MKKDLLDGYQVARDPTEWRRERADKHAEYVELLAAAEAAKDELESDDAGEAVPKADGKKRKRPSAAAAKEGDKKKKVTTKAPKSKGVSGPVRLEIVGRSGRLTLPRVAPPFQEADSAPASKKAKTTASSALLPLGSHTHSQTGVLTGIGPLQLTTPRSWSRAGGTSSRRCAHRPSP